MIERSELLKKEIKGLIADLRKESAADEISFVAVVTANRSGAVEFRLAGSESPLTIVAALESAKADVIFRVLFEKMSALIAAERHNREIGQ